MARREDNGFVGCCSSGMVGAWDLVPDVGVVLRLLLGIVIGMVLLGILVLSSML